MSTVSETKSSIGSFTAEAFAAHLASLAGSPAWWLERKRAAYEKFAALPLPKRTDETWRFSNISTLTLDGFTVGRAGSKATSSTTPFGPASLTFVNNALAGRGTLTPELSSKGVVVTTLADAAVKYADMLKAHFMAQPQ